MYMYMCIYVYMLFSLSLENIPRSRAFKFRLSERCGQAVLLPSRSHLQSFSERHPIDSWGKLGNRTLQEVTAGLDLKTGRHGRSQVQAAASYPRTSGTAAQVDCSLSLPSLHLSKIPPFNLFQPIYKSVLAFGSHGRPCWGARALPVLPGRAAARLNSPTGKRKHPALRVEGPCHGRF